MERETCEGEFVRDFTKVAPRKILSCLLRSSSLVLGGSREVYFSNQSRFSTCFRKKQKKLGSLPHRCRLKRGGLSHPKNSIDFIGNGKAVLKEIMDEMPNFSVFKNNLNKAGQSYKDDSVLVDLQPDLKMANKVRMENEEDTSPGLKKSNRKESSAVGNYGVCDHLSDVMINTNAYVMEGVSALDGALSLIIVEKSPSSCGSGETLLDNVEGQCGINLVVDDGSTDLGGSTAVSPITESVTPVGVLASS
ncbi:hypothetical protein MA16_Dca010613 [Dendrobium catenatum]|uniref:Uncharacterized protein n=1 Tax=Dendrobium catenatum TaxID=906689 RepID=A0A2I0VZQ1_9ASPA|nr:hypothetical protein MA16_Dca010613 [Dendrobium catenatum]